MPKHPNNPRMDSRDDSAKRGVSAMLRLGELLDQFSFPKSTLGTIRPLRPKESIELRNEIQRLEAELTNIVVSRPDRLLWRALEYRKGDWIDPLLLRIVAHVGYHSLIVGQTGLGVSAIAKAASMGDMAEAVEARHIIRHLLIKALVIRQGSSGYPADEIIPGKALVRFLSGQNRLAIIWTTESISEEMKEWQLKHGSTTAIRHFPALVTRTKPLTPHETVPHGRPSSAKEIFNCLRQTVISLDPIVRQFSVHMSVHLRRVAILERGEKPSTPPVVVLLAGASGCGKTHLCQEFGRIAGLAFASGNMAEVTSSAYAGVSLDELFIPLLMNAEKTSEAEKGVMFLDEIDKRKSNDCKGGFDATGMGVTTELLKILEGTQLQISGRRSNDSAKGYLNTHGMAFCLAGSFSGLADAMKETKKAMRGIGFGMGTGNDHSSLGIREALRDYFPQEFINRISTVITVPTPTVPQLMEVATSPNGTIETQNRLMREFGLTISMTNDAIREVAEWALASRTLARGMRSLLQAASEEAIFEERQGELKIGLADVRGAIDKIGTEISDL